jgi:hypothetical protein
MIGGLGPTPEANADQRARLRWVLRPETVNAILMTKDRVEQRTFGEIPIDDAVTAEDLKLEWLRNPAVRLIQSIGLLAASGLDGKPFGKLPRRFERIASSVAEVTELGDFLSHFDSEILRELWLPILDAAVFAAADLALALTAEDDGEARRAHSLYEAQRDEFETTHYGLLSGLRFMNPQDLGLEFPSARDHAKKIFGVDLFSRKLRKRHGHQARHLQEAGYDPKNVADQQFSYIGPLEVPEESVANYLDFAIRIGSTRFPLLAHRAVYLTNQLVREASSREPKLVHAFVERFFKHEATWVMASGPKFDQALHAYLEDDNRPAVVEALRILSEGVLRPYGSLICALGEVLEGDPPTAFSVEPTLGALERRVGALDHPAARLLASFVPRELRNADAHESATTGASGELIIRNDDRTTQTVDANDVFGRTASLRSALDGVDVAVNLFFATDLMETANLHNTPEDWSLETLTGLAREAAHQRTRGTVERVESDNGVLTVIYRGRARTQELGDMLAALAGMTYGYFRKLVVANRRGRVLAQLERMIVEPTHEGDLPHIPDQ